MRASLALEPFQDDVPRRRSALHALVLGLVWLSIAASSVVFSEPAPVDIVTMGLILLLPLVRLLDIRPVLACLLGVMLVAGAAGIVASTNAGDLGLSITHTGVSIYLYLATFTYAAFVAMRPGLHTRLILNGYLWATCIAAVCGIIGYFDLIPGAYDLMTRYSRATGLFKDPNVYGPFLVLGVVYAFSLIVTRPPRRALIPALVLVLLSLGMLLSFSRGAWANCAIAIILFSALYFLTAATHRQRAKLIAIAVVGGLGLSGLFLVALQFDAISGLLSHRAALTQDYDEGPQGRFGGQQKAIRLAIDNPLGIGAQQFSPFHHHEEPHNVYISMFLNAGWLGGLIFITLSLVTVVLGARHALVRSPVQPLFLVVYAAFVGHVMEGALIDLDHWRHYYLLLALVWGLMASGRAGTGADTPRRAAHVIIPTTAVSVCRPATQQRRASHLRHS
jgi:hypothetical protein